MTLFFISDRNYVKHQEIKSLTELADYSTATVEGTRIGAKIVIPECVTFQRFPENRTNKEQAEPTKTARLRFDDYKRLKDSYRASGNSNGRVDSLLSMAESYL